MAKVVLARSARAALFELDWQIADAVEKALALLERDPLAGHALRGRLRGLRSLRVGSYRVIYHVTEDERTARDSPPLICVPHRSALRKASAKRGCLPITGSGPSTP